MTYWDDSLELTKRETQMAKGIAILAMVILHLFCRLGDLPYTPWLYIGNTPLVYYFGQFGGICVPIYCFCSGYAHYLLREREGKRYFRRILPKALSFLCNYWIVLLLFSVVGLVLGNEVMPISWKTFLGNVFLYGMSYNGAWWFVLTYLLLLVLSPLTATVIKKIPSTITFFSSGVVYFILYLFQHKISITFPHPIGNWLWTQFLLLGTTQFSYAVGMIFRKERLISRMREIVEEKNRKNIRLVARLIVASVPLLMFLLSSLIPSAILTPITGIGTIVCFWLMKKPPAVAAALYYFGHHSTNVWLVHMFFYTALFDQLVFKMKYPLPILILMLMICLCASYVIQWLYNPLNKLMNQSGYQKIRA